MNEQTKVELLKLSVQVIETVLDDDVLYNDTLYKAKCLYKDLDVADYIKLIMYIRKDLTELIKS